MSNITLGQKIKKYRKRAGMSQLDLEMAIDTSAGTISRIEKGKVNPTKETLLQISDQLELTSLEISNLFNIEIEKNFVSVLKTSKKLYTSKDIRSLLRTSVDEIVYDLGLLSSFITILRDNKLQAQTTTNNIISRLGLKAIGKPLDSLSISMIDNNNLLVKSIIKKKSLCSNYLRDFIYPTIPNKLISLLEKISGFKSGVVIPIFYEGTPKGTIFFCKQYRDDFRDEMEILEAFAENIAFSLHSLESQKSK